MASATNPPTSNVEAKNNPLPLPIRPLRNSKYRCSSAQMKPSYPRFSPYSMSDKVSYTPRAQQRVVTAPTTDQRNQSVLKLLLRRLIKLENESVRFGERLTKLENESHSRLAKLEDELYPLVKSWYVPPFGPRNQLSSFS
jgi:hypothetical protein